MIEMGKEGEEENINNPSISQTVKKREGWEMNSGWKGDREKRGGREAMEKVKEIKPGYLNL